MLLAAQGAWPRRLVCRRYSSVEALLYAAPRPRNQASRRPSFGGGSGCGTAAPFAEEDGASGSAGGAGVVW
jgi:hypothetical protein